MTSVPPHYPYQVVSNWITAKDVYVLTDSTKRELMDVTLNDCPNPLYYDIHTRFVRKMQAKTIAAVGCTIGTAIGRVVSNSIDSLRNHLRARQKIEQLSYLLPRLLEDIGIPYKSQVRVRALLARRQPDRLHL